MTPRDYLREPYGRVVMPDESGGYYAEVLEFPGCFAEGNSVEETYRELENAAESWIEVRLSQGQDIPAPFSNLDYSGTVSLRIPRSIHKKAAIMAKKDRVSLNSFLMTAIASRVGAEDFCTTLTNRLENRIMEAANSTLGYISVARTQGKTLLPLKKFEKTATTSTNVSKSIKIRG
jgi:antitoxin HicB